MGRYNGKNVAVTARQYKCIESLSRGDSITMTVHRVPKSPRVEIIAGGRKPIKCKITQLTGVRRRGVNEVTLTRL